MNERKEILAFVLQEQDYAIERMKTYELDVVMYTYWQGFLHALLGIEADIMDSE